MKANKKILNARPKEYKGITYRSVLEANCAKIFEEYHVPVRYEPFKITLLPKFRYNGVLVRSITYKPDFVGDNFIVECKGYPNDNWHDKRKWVMHHILNNMPKYTFYEIHNVTQLRILLNKLKNESKSV